MAAQVGPLSPMRGARALITIADVYGQPPRVAVLLELRDNMIRDGVAFVLGQGLLETTNDLRDRMTRHRKGQPDPASERPEPEMGRSFTS